MDYSFLDFLSLIGAVGLFLYGMKVMSEGLQRATGSRLRSILSAMTRNRFMGVTTGILITALIQSSSASTVMVVSFVNAGLMSLEQSMAVIFGANVGTTFTAWLVTIFGFKVDMGAALLPILAMAVPMMMVKSGTYKNLGEFLVGFVFLFMGLSAIGTHVPNLDHSPEIFQFLAHYSSMGIASVLLALLVGLLITLIIQSSSATFAIVLIMGVKGWIPFDMACAMVLGSNIGTTITPLLASLGANIAAKKAAMGHLLFNCLGTLWTVVLYSPFVSFIVWMTKELGHGDPESLYAMVNSGRAIAPAQLAELQLSMSLGMSFFHTVFNIINLMVMIWFTKTYVKIVNYLVKSHHKEDEEFQLKYISGGLLSASELNIMQAQREIVVYAERVDRMLGMVKQLVHTKTGTVEFNKIYSRIGKYEDISDRMEIEIANYLNKVVEGRLSYDGKLRVSTMLSFVSEIESIADSCNNMARTLVRKEEVGAHFEKYNYDNIDTMLKYVSEAMSNMITVLLDPDNATEQDLMRNYNKEREINSFRNMLRTEKIQNINEHKYPYQAGIFYMDLICEAEKLGDFIVNVIDGVAATIRRQKEHEGVHHSEEAFEAEDDQ